MQHDERSLEFVARGNAVRGVSDGVSVHAGFPNPAAELGSAVALSLDRLLVAHPSSTYFFRIQGDAWAEQGIFDGDIAIIDRAPSPSSSDLVICWHDHGFTIVRTSNLTDGNEPWGVSTSIIHQYKR